MTDQTAAGVKLTDEQIRHFELLAQAWQGHELGDVGVVVLNLIATIRALQVEIQVSRLCSVCTGTGTASGAPCICGGTGSAVYEMEGLRRRLFDAERSSDTARAALDALRLAIAKISRSYSQRIHGAELSEDPATAWRLIAGLMDRMCQQALATDAPAVDGPAEVVGGGE